MAASFTVTSVATRNPNVFDVEVSFETHGQRISVRRGAWSKHTADHVADAVAHFLLDTARGVSELDDTNVTSAFDGAVLSLGESARFADV